MVNLPRNVFRVCPENVQTAAPVVRVQTKDFKIFRMSNGELLRVCKEQITIDDLKKAARCARYSDKFRVYAHATGSASGMLKESDFPIRKNVYLTEAQVRKNISSASKTKIFSVCESTSTPPVRRTTITPIVPVQSAKKKLLRKAIDALQIATRALEELYTTI